MHGNQSIGTMIKHSGSRRAHKKHIVGWTRAQWGEQFDFKPEDLSLILQTCVVEGREQTLTRCPLTPTHTPWHLDVHTHIHTKVNK